LGDLQDLAVVGRFKHFGFSLPLRLINLYDLILKLKGLFKINKIA